MTHYLLLSGGMDSVLLLRDLMDTLKDNPADKLLLLYVNASFTLNKQPQEIIAVEKSLKWMSEHYPNEWKRVERKVVELRFHGYPHPDIIGLQSLYWLPTIMCYIDISDDATLYTTTITTDELTIAVEEFDQCFMLLHDKALMMKRHGNNPHTFEIKHPFLNYGKGTIISLFVEQMPELFQYAVSCEHTEKNFCGMCMKCSEIIGASIAIISRAKEEKPEIAKFLKNFLNEKYGIQYNQIENHDPLTYDFDGFFNSTTRSEKDTDETIQAIRKYYCEKSAVQNKEPEEAEENEG